MQSSIFKRRHVHGLSRVENLSCLKESWLNLEPGVSGGFGGMINKYLRCAAQNWDEEQAVIMEEFGLKHLNGGMPPWLYKVWNSVSTVSFFKSAEKDPSKLRPVGIKPCINCNLNKTIVTHNKSVLREYPEPLQLALIS